MIFLKNSLRGIMQKILLTIFSLFIFISPLRAETETPQTLEGTILTTTKTSYTLEKRLGAGAFGEVYRAFDEQGNKVAIKLFILQEDGKYFYFITHSWPTQHPKNTKIYKEFASLLTPNKEWENGQLFAHSNIISALDKGEITEINNVLYDFIVYEYVEGTTVGKMKKMSMAREEALLLAIQFLETHEYALTFEKIYFDLHLYNFMISADKTLKVIDIGSFWPLDVYENGFRKKTKMSQHFKRIYWLVKEILKKGDFNDEELNDIKDSLKAHIQKIFNLKIRQETLADFSSVLREWVIILQDKLSNLEMEC